MVEKNNLIFGGITWQLFNQQELSGSLLGPRPSPKSPSPSRSWVLHLGGQRAALRLAENGNENGRVETRGGAV